MSRIRANQITNQSADGAPTVQHGLIIAGVSTFTGSVSIGGTLTYEDVTNIDSIGIITARSGVDVDDFVSVGSNIHLGNAGIITATSFVGDGSGLTGAGPSLTGSTNNTVVTVTGSNAIQGEANLTFDGDTLLLKSSTDGRRVSFAGDGTSHYMKYDNTLGGIILNGYGGITFETNGTNERLRIDSSGRMGLGTNSASSYNSKAYNFVISSSGHAGMTIAGGTSSDSSIYFADGTSGAAQYAGWVQYEHDNNALTFGVNATERVRIPSTGGIELKTDGKGIQFPTPQTPTNADTNRVGISSEMRYYETGTVTPGLSSTVLNGLQIATFTDGSYARRVNRYVRVGHIVHCFIEIKMAGSVTYNAGSTSTAPVCIVGTCPFRWSYNNRYDVSGEPDYIPCSVSYDSSGLSNDTLYATLQRNYNAQPRVEITKPGSGGSSQYNSTNFGEVFPANARVSVAYSYPTDLDNADY